MERAPARYVAQLGEWDGFVIKKQWNFSLRGPSGSENGRYLKIAILNGQIHRNMIFMTRCQLLGYSTVKHIFGISDVLIFTTWNPPCDLGKSSISGHQYRVGNAHEFLNPSLFVRVLKVFDSHNRPDTGPGLMCGSQNTFGAGSTPICSSL